MSFFGKLKQGLGIGGVKPRLEIPAQVSKDAGIVNGTVFLTTKRPQQVTGIKVIMREVVTTGDTVEDRRTEEFKLGDTTSDQPFAIQPGEEKRIDFTLPFAARHTAAESLAREGGVLGALGQVGQAFDERRSRYYVIAQVTVEGTVLGPSVSKSISLV